MNFTSMKLALLSVIILGNANLQSNPHESAKNIIIAVAKKSTNDGNCPAGINKIIKLQSRNINPAKIAHLKKIAHELTLDEKGYLFTAILELFFDELNKDPFRVHVDTFAYFSEIAKSVDTPREFSQFVASLKKIQQSSKPSEIGGTMKSGLENLYETMSKTPNKALAAKIKHNITQYLKPKNVMNIICMRAKDNR